MVRGTSMLQAGERAGHDPRICVKSLAIAPFATLCGVRHRLQREGHGAAIEEGGQLVAKPKLPHHSCFSSLSERLPSLRFDEVARTCSEPKITTPRMPLEQLGRHLRG